MNGTALDIAPYDVSSLNGPNPPNLLDLSSFIKEAQVNSIFKLLLAHPKVETILNTVLGGMVKFGVIADGIIKDCGELKLLALVVKLEEINIQESQNITTFSSPSLLALTWRMKSRRLWPDGKGVIPCLIHWGQKSPFLEKGTVHITRKKSFPLGGGEGK